jgi:hypothetical protein
VWDIANLVSEFYFVMYIGRCYNQDEPNLPDYRMQQIELYGTRDNLDIAEYVFYFLMNQADIQWKRYKKENDITKNRERQSFVRGMYEGFYKKLESQRDMLAQEKALIWLGDPKLDTFYKKRNPRVRTTQSHYTYHRDAHSAGSKVGASLNISTAMHAGPSEGKRRLLK